MINMDNINNNQAEVGRMKCLNEIIEIINSTSRNGAKCMIPLLQRNYKWSRECAAELAEDLWEAYQNGGGKKFQLNMVTFYGKYEQGVLKELQILDGQQRLITLKLFLTFLYSAESKLTFDFQRDGRIPEKEKTRKYFIDNVLGRNAEMPQKLTVDTERLNSNYDAMRIPLSFKTVFRYYKECLDKELKENIIDIFRNTINDRISDWVGRYGEVRRDGTDSDVFLMLNPEEINYCINYCAEFDKTFSGKEESEGVSNDEIRVTIWADKFQEIWRSKVNAVFSGNGFDFRGQKEKLAEYIEANTVMLYHETEAEPIEEFLNINEHKTRFVISDYIRANMISDNPLDGDLSPAEKQKNQENRKEVLRLFQKLANYLYNDKYKKIWQLIKVRYDDFEQYTDINRLKILFCDKYFGTSTQGYKFDSELKRLQYFEYILDSLVAELRINDDSSDPYVNTYNAIYMLLECKKKYRFFNIFTNEDIENRTQLNDVTARERFCFFEFAYKYAKSSEDFWDISYLLESQLYYQMCDIKKDEKKLPKNVKESDPWCCVNRGCEHDELYQCIEELIRESKNR